MTAANTNAAPGAATAQQPAAAEKKSWIRAGLIGKTAGAYMADPRAIVEDPGFNIRFDLGNIEELADLIDAKLKRDPESGGLIHAMGVLRLSKDDPLADGGKRLFKIVRGHRRNAAIGLLLKKGRQFEHGVPVTILDKGMDVQTATLEMFTENTGKPLLPLEQAAGFKRLKDGDPENGVPPMTLKQIEKATGFSDNTINAAFALLEADEEVVEAVKSRKVSASTAKEIAVHARGDKAKQKELITKAKEAKTKEAKRALKKDIEATQRAKHAKKGKVLKIRALDDKALSELGARLAASMVTKLKDARKAADADLRAWVKEDDKLALAATFGALEALKAAAGMRLDLDF